MMKRITVFTPTYNRGYILETLYVSLKKQTNQSFKWLIVDDGSTDNTEEIVRSWRNEGLIDLQYYKQVNAGKMAAHNKGVELCDTEFFLCIDSDDYLTNDAIETILGSIDSITSEKFAGLIAYKGTSQDEPIGTSFPRGVTTHTLSGLYDSGFKGDTTLVFKTNIIKKYPFPILRNEKFITEAYIYNQIDLRYIYHLIPKVLTICEYRSDGLTKNEIKLIFNNPGGWALHCCQNGDFAKTIIKRLKSYAWAISYKLMKKDSQFKLHPKHFASYVLSYPFGFLLFLRRIVKYKGYFKQ